LDDAVIGNFGQGAFIEEVAGVIKLQEFKTGTPRVGKSIQLNQSELDLLQDRLR